MVERRRFGDLIPHLVLWTGIAIVAFPVYLCFVGSLRPTHFVDVTGHFDTAVASLEAHAAYNSALPEEFPKPPQLIDMILGGGGQAAGVEHAVLLDVIVRR